MIPKVMLRKTGLSKDVFCKWVYEEFKEVMMIQDSDVAKTECIK